MTDKINYFCDKENEIDKFAEKHSSVTIYDMASIKTSLAIIDHQIKDIYKSMEVWPLIADMAIIINISIDDAAYYVAQAMIGNSELLVKYCKELKGIDGNQGNCVVEVLKDKYGGAAQLQAKTLYGATRQIGNAIKEVALTIIEAIKIHRVMDDQGNLTREDRKGTIF